MDRLRPFRLTRRELLIVAGKSVIALSACSPAPEISPAPIPKPTPSPLPFHQASPGFSDWNYCQEVIDTSGDVEKKMAGYSVQSQEVSKAPQSAENVPDDIDLLKLTASNIITGNRPVDLAKLQIVLIPSGYDSGQLNQRMDYLINGLYAVYKGVNVQFSYLNFSTPFDIGHIKQLGDITDASVARFTRLMAKVGTVFPIDVGAIIAKSNEHFGRWSAGLPLASGDSPFSIVAAAHEIAHELGRKDGHRNRTYKREDINSEQLSLKPELLSPEVRKVYDQVNPAVIQMGFCGDEPVYSMDRQERNIMMHYTPDDAEILRVAEKEFIFNNIQRPAMNEFIEGLKARRPK